ncbi:MAG: DUF4157 domain-containing protein [Pseudomonadota bacterium]|nr:DUF4157 domain-containing protein [Pseudomonadota bacterium]
MQQRERPRAQHRGTEAPAQAPASRADGGNAERQERMKERLAQAPTAPSGSSPKGGPASSLPYRALMERAFGASALLDVRVQQSPEAAARLDALGARAAEVDGELLLRPGASPEEVAHELVHHVQAEGGKSGKATSSPGDHAETDAVALAAKAAKGEPVSVEPCATAEVNRWALPGLGSIVDAVTRAVPAVVSGAGSLVAAAGEKVGAAANTALDFVGHAASVTADVVGDGVAAVTDAAAKVTSGAADLVGDGVAWGADVVGDGLELAHDVTGGVIPTGGLDEKLDTWGQDVDGRLDEGGQAAAAVLTGAGAKVDQGLDTAGERVAATADGWGDWVQSGADAKGAQLHDGFDHAADYLEERLQGVRDVWSLDQEASLLYGKIDLPTSSGEFVQQYSEAGIPLTSEAWEMQDAIDGGTLHRLYDQSLVSHLAEAGLLEGALSDLDLDALPTHLADLAPEQMDQLLAAARAQYGDGQAFLDNLDPKLRRELQDDTLLAYIDEANASEDGTFILEMLPTDTSRTGRDLLEGLKDLLLLGRLPDDFRVGPEVGKARYTALELAGNAEGPVFALPVPYANVPSNVIARYGVPSDGSANMSSLLGRLDDDLTTVGTGYSQGGAAVWDQLTNQSEGGPRLDEALLLAPMGGTDGEGGTGVYAGQVNGTETLSVAHEADPAALIHADQNPIAFGEAMVNFVTQNSADDGAIKDLVNGMWHFRHEQEGDGALHGSTCEGVLTDAMACETRTPDQEAAELGTLGYPAEIVSQLADLLQSGDYEMDENYMYVGEWSFDLRELNATYAVEEVYDFPTSAND